MLRVNGHHCICVTSEVTWKNIIICLQISKLSRRYQKHVQKNNSNQQLKIEYEELTVQSRPIWWHWQKKVKQNQNAAGLNGTCWFSNLLKNGIQMQIIFHILCLLLVFLDDVLLVLHKIERPLELTMMVVSVCVCDS